MRQRKVKNLEEKYAGFEDILVYKSEEVRGNWAERSGHRSSQLLEDIRQHRQLSNVLCARFRMHRLQIFLQERQAFRKT